MPLTRQNQDVYKRQPLLHGEVAFALNVKMWVKTGHIESLYKPLTEKNWGGLLRLFGGDSKRCV